jgi:SYF2 splicing factor
VRDLVRLEKQRKLAETLRLRADAEERGEDVERQKNWEWTIEENEEWEKKLARKARKADFEFHGMFYFAFTYCLNRVVHSAVKTMRTLLGGNTRRMSISSSRTWRLTIDRRRLQWDSRQGRFHKMDRHHHSR